MTDDERDALLLRLEAGQKDLEAGVNNLQLRQGELLYYVKAIAKRVLSPAEVTEIETELMVALATIKEST